MTSLEPAADDADLADATDLVDVRARVLSMLAQALLGAGRPREAAQRVRGSLRLLRALEDLDGLAEVRKLQDRVVAAIAAEKEAERQQRDLERIGGLTVEQVLEGAVSPEDQADRLIKKATADEDVDLARRALAIALEAQSLREAVLARLSIARLDPSSAPAQIRAAYDAAERADAFTLVGTVVRAAELAGVELPRIAL